MEKLKQLPKFAGDEDIAVFMEAHDGFELVDDGLAEIVETPEFQRRSHIKLASETLTLLDDLVQAGICMDRESAINRAVHSYAIAVLPQAYRLVRKSRVHL